MPIFERENRYIVVKLTDLDPTQHEAILDILDLQYIPTRECVVVEAHWPIYEEVWALIENQWVSEITTDAAQV
jgi:hypothetical protein